MIKFLLLYSSKLIILLLIILILVLNFFSKKTNSDREKSSPFECGFDPKSSARTPFSLQFFLIAVIFIIFDIELAILLPMIMSMKTSNIMQFSIIFSVFVIILLIGLYHEWKKGALTWAK
uniref:NADH-ubiquinone oxidoreductase chain 3 n=1 Tax=Hypera postica TaxID=36757 RepID=J9PHQ6_9CUCU|nr:NADH dehydrogenase subunit 3 [Hypera postica]